MDAEDGADQPVNRASSVVASLKPKFESQRWLSAGVWFFVILGILIRLVRYLADYPIWHDEAFLACSLWDRDYVNLLRPLDYGQVAPWLFLAIERAIVTGLGYSALTLRLFPTCCSVLSVLLFFHVARRLLGVKAQILAVGIFATSFYLIRHGAEIKPYASDLLAALVLVAMAIEWLRSPASSRWLWGLAAIVPFLIAVSYPAVFVAGGISLALAPTALGSGRRTVRMGWVVFNLLLVAAFLSVYLASTVFQAAAILDEYRKGCWADSFPPLDRPWLVPVWLLDVHAGRMMAYPAGDNHGASAVTLLCVLAGCMILRRQGRTAVLAVMIAPAALGLVAAFMGRYPYGGAPRTMLYLAPAICLLAGLGLAHLLSLIQPVRVHRLAFLGSMVILGMMGVGLITRDVVMPYRVYDDVRSRDFARWFWTEYAQGGELVCLKSDVGLSFRRKLWRVGMSAVYLFHQRIYSDRHRHRRPADLAPGRYSESYRLRLVGFDELPVDHPAFRHWAPAVEHAFTLKKTETYVIQEGKPGEEWLRDAYVVREYVPRADDSRQLAREAGALPGGKRF